MLFLRRPDKAGFGRPARQRLMAGTLFMEPWRDEIPAWAGGADAVPCRMRQCLRQSQRSSDYRQGKVCRLIFIFRSMLRTAATRIEPSIALDPLFAI
jgi:hypothetical protein